MAHKISVIGAGSWGTALAQMFSQAGQDVMIYARDAGLAEQINTVHENNIYLPDHPLHKNLKATSDLKTAAEHADIVLMVTPTQYVRGVLEQMKPFLPDATPIISCAKGIEIATGDILADVTHDVLPHNPYGVLSGPNFAKEVVKGMPSAATLASDAPLAVVQGWGEALHTKTFRPYLSDDPVGVEIAGAVKNVIAIACGILEGRHMGQNARAAVITRGLAEARRLGLKKGARPETFAGLSGVGDMVLTCNSMTSRNFSLGVELGSGKTLDDILKTRRTVAEGAATAKALAQHAKTYDVDMPICLAVYDILYQNADIDTVITGLLSRDIRKEVE